MIVEPIISHAIAIFGIFTWPLQYIYIYIYIDINLYQLQYCGISIILPSGKVTKLSKIAI